MSNHKDLPCSVDQKENSKDKNTKIQIQTKNHFEEKLKMKNSKGRKEKDLGKTTHHGRSRIRNGPILGLQTYNRDRFKQGRATK